MIRGLHGRDHHLYHRRRCSICDCQLRAGLPTPSSRGRHRQGEGEAERRPGADGGDSRLPQRTWTGLLPSDYSIVPQTAVFNSGDTEKTLTFTATQDDAEDDDGERVRLTFGTLPPRVIFHEPFPGGRFDHRRRRSIQSPSASSRPAHTVAEGNSVPCQGHLSQPTLRADV